MAPNNKWVKKSIELANEENYLDKLHKVYPVNRGKRREISSAKKRKIQKAYEEKDKTALVKELLKVDKFPIEDPFVAFLRKEDRFLDLNKKTVERIANTLLEMDYKDIVDGIEEPKVFNRQLGTLFREFLPKLGYPFVDADKFDPDQKSLGQNKIIDIAFLKGSDQELKKFANTKLGCDLEKNPDLLARVGDKFVVGEAKFLTDYGGHQNAQFEDALNLLNSDEGNVIRIAVLDGVIWIKRDTKMFRKINKVKKPAFSALFLKDFLENLSTFGKKTKGPMTS